MSGTDEWDKKSAVTKSNFLAVYARAHMRALTPENILAAFRKMRVVSLNPDMVTVQMMAPSLEIARSSTLPLKTHTMTCISIPQMPCQNISLMILL